MRERERERERITKLSLTHGTNFLPFPKAPCLQLYDLLFNVRLFLFSRYNKLWLLVPCDVCIQCGSLVACLPDYDWSVLISMTVKLDIHLARNIVQTMKITKVNADRKRLNTRHMLLIILGPPAISLWLRLGTISYGWPSIKTVHDSSVLANSCYLDRRISRSWILRERRALDSTFILYTRPCPIGTLHIVIILVKKKTYAVIELNYARSTLIPYNYPFVLF